MPTGSSQPKARDGPPPFKRPKITECSTTKKSKVARTPKNVPAKSTRGKKAVGKLSKFPTLPLDIIYEIVSNMEPLDLVHLSRVSKDFRALLHPAVNKALWVAARRNMEGLPDCPSDLNECQYAVLLFELKCQVCESTCKSESVDYTIRCRLCQQCRKELVRQANKIGSSNLPFILPGFPPDQRAQILSLLPRSTQVANGTLYNYTGRENTAFDSYFVPELKKIWETWSSLRNDEVKLDKFVDERRAAVVALHKTGREMQVWAGNEATEKRQQKSQTVEGRANDIEERLKELGYTKNDFPRALIFDPHSSVVEWHGHLNQAKPLTARSWKILEPKLVGILESVKEHRKVLRREGNVKLRSQELLSLWEEFFENHVTDPEKRKLRLPFRLFSLSPTIRALISEQEAEVPITLARLGEHAEDILADHDKKLEEQKVTFAKLIPEAPGDTSPDDLLERATSLFTCNLCPDKSNLMPFAQVLRHRHARLVDWQPSHFSCQKDVKALAEAIIEELEIPETASMDDMVVLEGMLACGCGNPEMTNRLMGYVEFICHVHQEDRLFKEISSQWRSDYEHPILNDHATHNLSTLVEIRDGEGEEEEPTTSESESSAAHDSATSVCSICFSAVGRKTELPSKAAQAYHFEAKHGLEWSERHIRKIQPFNSYDMFPAALLDWCSYDSFQFDDYDSEMYYSDEDEEGCVIA